MQNNPDKTKILNVIKIAADIGRKAPLMNALNRQAQLWELLKKNKKQNLIKKKCFL